MIQQSVFHSNRKVQIHKDDTHEKQDLITLPEHLRSPKVFGGGRVAYSLVLYVVSCVLLFVCLSFSFLGMALSVYFSIYEFDCPSCTFRHSFKDLKKKKLKLIIRHVNYLSVRMQKHEFAFVYLGPQLPYFT